jgi:hypothetical protein
MCRGARVDGRMQRRLAMADGLKAGDKVKWASSQGEVKGRVVKKVTSPTKVKGHAAKASPDDPQFLVESEKTGAEAVHKPTALKKR